MSNSNNSRTVMPIRATQSYKSSNSDGDGAADDDDDDDHDDDDDDDDDEEQDEQHEEEAEEEEEETTATTLMLNMGEPGTSVHVVAKPSDCLGLVKPEGVYVVQPHIKDPIGGVLPVPVLARDKGTSARAAFAFHGLIDDVRSGGSTRNKPFKFNAQCSEFRHHIWPPSRQVDATPQPKITSPVWSDSDFHVMSTIPSASRIGFNTTSPKACVERVPSH